MEFSRGCAGGQAGPSTQAHRSAVPRLADDFLSPPQVEDYGQKASDQAATSHFTHHRHHHSFHSESFATPGPTMDFRGFSPLPSEALAPSTLTGHQYGVESYDGGQWGSQALGASSAGDPVTSGMQQQIAVSENDLVLQYGARMHIFQSFDEEQFQHLLFFLTATDRQRDAMLKAGEREIDPLPYGPEERQAALSRYRAKRMRRSAAVDDRRRGPRAGGGRPGSAPEGPCPSRSVSVEMPMPLSARGFREPMGVPHHRRHQSVDFHYPMMPFPEADPCPWPLAPEVHGGHGAPWIPRTASASGHFDGAQHDAASAGHECAGTGAALWDAHGLPSSAKPGNLSTVVEGDCSGLEHLPHFPPPVPASDFFPADAAGPGESVGVPQSSGAGLTVAFQEACGIDSCDGDALTPFLGQDSWHRRKASASSVHMPDLTGL